MVTISSHQQIEKPKESCDLSVVFGKGGPLHESCGIGHDYSFYDATIGKQLDGASMDL